MLFLLLPCFLLSASWAARDFTGSQWLSMVIERFLNGFPWLFVVFSGFCRIPASKG